MNERTIAIVRLAPGNVGWYDRLTSIHLTISNPTAEVRAGMNLTNVKKAIQHKTISIIQGSLEGEPIITTQQVEEVAPVATDFKEEVKEEKTEIVSEEKVEEDNKDTKTKTSKKTTKKKNEE